MRAIVNPRTGQMLPELTNHLDQLELAHSQGCGGIAPEVADAVRGEFRCPQCTVLHQHCKVLLMETIALERVQMYCIHACTLSPCKKLASRHCVSACTL